MNYRRAQVPHIHQVKTKHVTFSVSLTDVTGSEYFLHVPVELLQ